MNLEYLDADDGKNDGNEVNRREDGGDKSITSQEDIFANIDINLSPLAWIFMLCTCLSLLIFFKRYWSEISYIIVYLFVKTFDLTSRYG